MQSIYWSYIYEANLNKINKKKNPVTSLLILLSVHLYGIEIISFWMYSYIYAPTILSHYFADCDPNRLLTCSLSKKGHDTCILFIRTTRNVGHIVGLKFNKFQAKYRYSLERESAWKPCVTLRLICKNKLSWYLALKIYIIHSI